MSTMLDTFDAPMSDYTNDLDVLMQAHSSDPWPPLDDGVMEEDPLSSFQMTMSKSSAMEFSSNHSIPAAEGQIAFSASQASTDIEIEVDMEDYSEENQDAEFEMLDDSEVIVEDSHEVQDVEVVDAHSSPGEIPVSISSSFTPTPHILEESLSTAPDITPVDSTSALDQAHRAPSAEVPPYAEEVSVLETVEVLTPPVPEQAGPNAETMGGTSATDDGPQEDAKPAAPSFGGEQPTGEEPVNENEPLETHDNAVSSLPEGDYIQVNDNAHNVSETISSEEMAHVQIEEDDDDELAGHSPASNPHEIADGVYIEPPPAVIIHIANSEQPFVLFNRPSSSRSHTPTSLDTDVPADSVVLLQEHPTLYYEPLSTLFDSLREEDPLNKQADIHQSELGFFIESLELTIFEDNAYARDVTLHDLSILHDSFHTGLLRLQLQQRTPRFVIRYQELQEQLQRLLQEDTFPSLPVSASDTAFDEKASTTGQVNASEEVQARDAEEVPPRSSTSHTSESQPTTFDDAPTEPTDGHDTPEVNDDHEQGEIQESSDESHPYVEQHLEDDGAAPGDIHDDDGSRDHEEYHHDDQAQAAFLPPGDNEDEHVVSHEERTENPPTTVHTDNNDNDNPSEENEDQLDPDDSPVLDSEDPVEPAEQAEVAEELYQGDDGDESSEHSDFHHEEDQELEYQDEDHHHEHNFAEEYEHESFGEVEHFVSEEHLENEYQGDQEVVERPPSPGAEKELPPVHTEDQNAGDDNALLDPSTSTTTGWSGEQFVLPGDETQEPLHTDAVDDTEEHIDNPLTYADVVDGNDDDWNDDLDGEGEVDPTWDQEEEEDTNSNESSVTLASPRSKRSFHDIDPGEEEELEFTRLTTSPDFKRSRLH